MEYEERRRDVRCPASPPAQILRLGSTERIEILNASYRGLFVRLSGPPPATTELLKLRIDLPERSIIAHAVVVRVVIDASGRAGAGLRFFAFNGEARSAWESYIAGLIHPRRAAAA
jgi:hypothetical protein